MNARYSRYCNGMSCAQNPSMQYLGCHICSWPTDVPGSFTNSRSWASAQFTYYSDRAATYSYSLRRLLVVHTLSRYRTVSLVNITTRNMLNRVPGWLLDIARVLLSTHFRQTYCRTYLKAITIRTAETRIFITCSTMFCKQFLITSTYC